MKCCAKIESLFVNIECAAECSFEKVNLINFFYLLNHILCLMKFAEYSCIKPQSFTQIRATIAEIQKIFRDCLLLAHPVHSLSTDV